MPQDDQGLQSLTQGMPSSTISLNLFMEIRTYILEVIHYSCFYYQINRPEGFPDRGNCKGTRQVLWNQF